MASTSLRLHTHFHMALVNPKHLLVLLILVHIDVQLLTDDSLMHITSVCSTSRDHMCEKSPPIFIYPEGDRCDNNII